MAKAQLQDMTPGQLKGFIAEYTEECWNKGRIESMTRYYDPAYLHHDVSRPDVQTLSQYQQWGRDLLSAFPDLRVNADDLIADGEKAVKRWTAVGVHKGALAGIQPTGRPVRFSGVSIYRMSGGLIAESWYVYDLHGLIQQLTAQA
jgi:steroid delta-isomerase-like uncharacterized protein